MPILDHVTKAEIPNHKLIFTVILHSGVKAYGAMYSWLKHKFAIFLKN